MSEELAWSADGLREEIAQHAADALADERGWVDMDKYDAAIRVALDTATRTMERFFIRFDSAADRHGAMVGGSWAWVDSQTLEVWGDGLTLKEAWEGIAEYARERAFATVTR